MILYEFIPFGGEKKICQSYDEAKNWIQFYLGRDFGAELQNESSDPRVKVVEVDTSEGWIPMVASICSALFLFVTTSFPLSAGKGKK